MILDTSFLVDLIQGKESAINKNKELEEKDETLRISAASVFELYSGIERSNKPEEEKQKVKEVIGSKTILDANSTVMKKSGRLHGEKINEGERLSAFDSIIASTALIKEEKILTKDQDFAKIDNLNTEYY